ncbi:MAG: ABC transporter substrate-binding protein [Oscillospiraceae bacterium]|nr:ABC transporter substrate-binding protein [Oscillospiraceae bacterium]
MNKLKKSLALIATLAIASSAFVACGDDSSSSSTAANSSTAESSAADSTGESTGESGGESTPDTPAERPENKVPSDDDKLTVLAWTDDDLKNMFKNFADNTDYTADNLVFEKVGGKGQEARDQYPTYFNSGKDVDLFVLEADWIKDYIDKDDMTAPLTNLGFADADFNNGYDYVKKIGTNDAGVIKGSSWQATPGAYVYRSDIAKEVFGAETPADFQQYVKDWDTFTASAAKVKEQKNMAMVDTLGGLWQVWSYNRASAWTDASYNLVIDDFCKKYADLAKDYYDKGYVTKAKQWETWDKAVQNGETMGIFQCTWCFGRNGVLNGLEGNGETPDGAETWTVDGPFGSNWALTQGPSGWAWGGSWLALSPKANSGKIAHDFVEYFTINAETMRKYAEFSGDFVNSPSAMKAIVDAGTNKNAYLGGQDQFAILYDAAANVKMDNITRYDSVLKDYFNQNISKYVEGTFSSSDEAIEGFKKDVKANVPDLAVS